MRSRKRVNTAELAAVAAGIALASCAAAATPVPVLTGAVPVARPSASPAAAPATLATIAALTGDELRCPVFADGCLASDGVRASDCPAPLAPEIRFATNSAVLSRAGWRTVDRISQDIARLATGTRVIISADAARTEPADLAQHRVDAVKRALQTRGVHGHGIVTVATAVFLLDQIPEPPTNRVEITLRGCREPG